MHYRHQSSLPIYNVIKKRIIFIVNFRRISFLFYPLLQSTQGKVVILRFCHTHLFFPIIICIFLTHHNPVWQKKK